MTTVYITDEGRVERIECVSDGQDFMADVIGENDTYGRWCDCEEADFQMSREEFEWWSEWAYREQRILDKANELGEDAIEGISRLGTEYDDLDALHDAQERYLGL